MLGIFSFFYYGDNCFSQGTFKANANSRLVLRVDPFLTGYKTVILLGLGGCNQISIVLEAQRLGKAIASICNEMAFANAVVALGDEIKLTSTFKDNIGHGIYEGLYSDNRYRKKTANSKNSVSLSKVKLLTRGQLIEVSGMESFHRSHIAAGVKFARDLVGSPPNVKTPLLISSLAQQIARDLGLTCTVLNERECLDKGMGGYLAVQQGSKFPPQFIHLVYKPDLTVGSQKPIKLVLIGKGLTFDSGGYNLKVGASSQIELMKFDMGGCAAVLGCAIAIGEMKPKDVEVHFISAVCENMISADAMRPGDIVFASNGKGIEIINTDAEGRLTLADALVYAESIGDVDAIVDLATLTGACVVGLGDNVAGLFSSHNDLKEALMAAAERTGDKIWPLPLEDSYRDRIKSKIADIQNVGGSGGGGSITAALFLQEFVSSKTRWAHLDIAGPVWDSAQSKPTGYGVKLLVEFILNFHKFRKTL